jgi:hypothetical protein
MFHTGNARLPVKGPKTPTPPLPKGTCGVPAKNMDVWGGDVTPPHEPCPTCGLFTIQDCCDLCL